MSIKEKVVQRALLAEERAYRQRPSGSVFEELRKSPRGSSIETEKQLGVKGDH